MLRATYAFLVLNDNATNRLLVRSLLEQTFPGCSVTESVTAADALGHTRKAKFDAILTDSQLAGPDGSEFVREARAEGASCPFLVITGSIDPAAHQRAYAAGATRVFFGSDLSFADYLNELLRGRRSSLL